MASTNQKGERRLRYSWAFKREVVVEYRGGQYTQAELAVKYGLTEKIVNHWVARFGKDVGSASVPKIVPTFIAMTNEEQKQYNVLKEQNEALKKELEFAQMKTKAMEIMIDLAREEYGIDIRKKSGAKQPVKLNTTTRRQK